MNANMLDINGEHIEVGDIVKVTGFSKNDRFLSDLKKFKEEIFKVHMISYNSRSSEFFRADLETIEPIPGKFQRTLNCDRHYGYDRKYKAEVFYIGAAKLELFKENKLPEGYIANSLVQRGE